MIVKNCKHDHKLNSIKVGGGLLSLTTPRAKLKHRPYTPHGQGLHRALHQGQKVLNVEFGQAVQVRLKDGQSLSWEGLIRYILSKECL
jgi:hypothetical protein